MTEPKVRIAIVDDNEVMMDLMVDLLESLPNFDVVGKAYDGKQGIELIAQEKPEVVILDLCMPYIDGLGVMENFQSDKDKYFPKFIITSCVGQEHITSKAMKLGAAYYMIKPLDYDNFVNRLNELAVDIVDTGRTEEVLMRPNLTSVASNTTPVQSLYNDPRPIGAKVSELLHQLGVPPHTKGYAYLKDSILLVYEDVKYMMKITKNLYPTIAKMHETTASRVERSIRNTIELTLERGDQELLLHIFGHAVKTPNSKLTNSEFIAIIAEKIKSGV